MGNVKVYVGVDVGFDECGRMTPRRLTWEDGRRFAIDRVLEVRPAASLKAGGLGDRYTVRVQGRETYLFFEHVYPDDGVILGRWFVERRGQERAVTAD